MVNDGWKLYEKCLAHCDRLQTERDRYREALESIANEEWGWDDPTVVNLKHRAKQALSGNPDD